MASLERKKEQKRKTRRKRRKRKKKEKRLRLEPSKKLQSDGELNYYISASVGSGHTVSVHRDKVVEPLHPAGVVVLAGLKPRVTVRRADRDPDELLGSLGGWVAPGNLVRVALKVAGLGLEEAHAGVGHRTATVPVEAVELSPVGVGDDPVLEEEEE